MASQAAVSRPHRLSLVAMVVVVVWLVGWVGLPMWDRLASLQQQMVVVEGKLSRLRRLAARQPAIEEAYQAHAQLWSAESEDSLQGAFLDELEQLAVADRLRISLQPRPMQRQEGVLRLGVECDVDGTQEALLAFLDHLLASPLLLELERLRIAATASKDSPLRATLLVTKVVLRQ